MRKISAFVLALQLLLLPAAGYAADSRGMNVKPEKALAEPAGQIMRDVVNVSNPSSNTIEKNVSTTLDEKYVVISNESTNDTSTQPTGSFDIRSISKNVKSGTYQVDYKQPVNVAGNQGNLIRKSTMSAPIVYKVGDTRKFWVTNLTNGIDYQITARLAYTNPDPQKAKALVWVNNNQITDADAAKLGTEFDTKIYGDDVTNFGTPPDINHDGKINILCYDIQDGFSGSGGYVAGYFGAEDLYNTSTSNDSEIFYIDTYPTMGTGPVKDVTQAFSTLAHEFQHMINYNENVLVEHGQPMDTWMDEGLAQAAEQIYTQQGLADRRDYYNESSTIQNGQSLLYWDDAGDTLSNYSLSYLFFQYLKIQCGQGDQIFKEIIDDPNNNYKAVEDVAKKYISPDMTFGKLMTDFRIALLLKNPTGLYGFKGDPFFNFINTPIFAGSSTNLRGGGAVVEAINSANGFSVPANKGANVTYTFLDKTPVAAGADQTPPATATVNVIGDHDTQITGKTEPGATVYAMVGQTEIGEALAASSGAFKMYILKQPGGTVVHVYAEDALGNAGPAATITVMSSPKGWVLSNGSWYYYSAVTGKPVTGWQQVGGKSYYFDEKGIMKTGWQQVSGKSYYFDEKGIMKTGWQQVSGKSYYFDEKGVMKTGWQQVSGKWYYFDGKGVMKTGWQTLSGKRYYFDGKGVMKTGWQTLSGKRYYFDGKGVMKTGWQTLSGKRYYFDGKGVMKTGWVKLSRKWYYFNRQGVMKT